MSFVLIYMYFAFIFLTSLAGVSGELLGAGAVERVISDKQTSCVVLTGRRRSETRIENLAQISGEALLARAVEAVDEVDALERAVDVARVRIAVVDVWKRFMNGKKWFLLFAIF